MKSAVQTATADGGFEETRVESKQVDAINQRNAHKPLFEQLRHNQEEEDAKEEELKREMMRGTCALDEEDVAHLDALAKQRQAREQAIQDRTQQELAQFRAARAERQQTLLQDDDDDDNNHDGDGNATQTTEQTTTTSLATTFEAHTTAVTSTGTGLGNPLQPKIVIKKRKRRDVGSSGVKPASKIRSNNESEKKATDDKKETDSKAHEKPSTAGGLGSLLSGYGSSDDDSD